MAGFDGREYQSRFDTLAASGVDIHGEATLVRSYRPGSVLDAGCGTGRVAIELARHGVDVLGVDTDPSMIAEARRRGPGLRWVHADLCRFDAGRTFDVVVLAGNVPLFCPAEDRDALVATVSRHVGPGGRLVAGFSLDGRYELAHWDLGAAAAGLELEDRFSTWDRRPFEPGSDYSVSVHWRPPEGQAENPR